MRRLVLLLAVALLVVGWVSLPPAPQLTVAGAPQIGGHDRIVGLDSYAPSGTTAVGYRHGAGVTVTLPLRNDGAQPVEVVAVDPFPELLGMLEVELVGGDVLRLAPGEEDEVELTARFTNCEYYTERAMNLYRGATVTVAGLTGPRTVEVAYPREVVLRSPTILGCPDRVTDRSARQRLLATDD